MRWFSVLCGLVAFQVHATVMWRMPDGTLTDPPETADVSEHHAQLSPGLEGVPVFALPFSIEPRDVVSVELTVHTVITDEDADADGQAGVILSMLPATSQQTHNPNAEFRQIVIVGSEAETIRFAFRAAGAHPENGLLLMPTLSYFGRTLELSVPVFNNHGPDADPQALTSPITRYAGDAPDAPWRARANQMIDEHRKADLHIVLVDRWGEPLPDVSVQVEQMRHAYPFGTAVVASRLIDAPRSFDPEQFPDQEAVRQQFLEDNVRYREKIQELFNAVVFENDLKWPQWAGVRTDIRRQDWTLDSINWLHDHGFVIKGHCMVWGSWRFTPDWLRTREEEPEAVQQAALTHIRDIGHATADRAHYWDVLNEPMSHRQIIELLGMERIAEWFKEARRAVPDTRLVMNEFDIVGNGGNDQRRENFLEFYQELADLGAPLDVIGLQGHFWSERFTAPERIWSIIDRVHEATGLPLMISEFDTNFPNEQMQADYTGDFLTAWFAHPATEAFLKWGFWGGAHWMGDSGSMIRRDWTEKPVLEVYRQLVFNDWWTRENAISDESGRVTVRAFHGRHRITIEAPNGFHTFREVDVSSDGREVMVLVHEVKE